jgi:ribosome-binding protein aMBF1 (putative translation factor)
MSTNEKHWKILILVIREASKNKGITASKLATKCGVSRSTITRIFDLEFCPKLDLFISMSRESGINFFIEDQESDSDLSIWFEKAMTELGRRPEKLPKN